MYTLFRDDLQYIAETFLPLRSEFVGAKIFISGGTGFFGTWLVEALMYLNAQYHLNLSITILSRQPENFLVRYNTSFSNLHFIRGDIRTFLFTAEKYTHIIHAAAETCAIKNSQTPHEMSEVIINGTQRMLEFAKVAQVTKFLYVSSGAVYGQRYLRNSPAAPLTYSPYGIAKKMAESFCRQPDLNFHCTIARCFAFVGPYLPLDKHYAIGNFIHMGLNKIPIIINSDGASVRSYQYAADLVVNLLYVLCRGKHQNAYDVGAKRRLTILELAHLIAENFPDTEIIFSKNTDEFATCYAPEHKFQELEMIDNIELTYAIKKTISWHKQQAQTACG